MAKISKDVLKKLQKTLKTDAAIGAKFKISRQAVHQLRMKYGIGFVANKNKDRDEKILSMYKKGKTGIVIAKQLDLSVSQIYRIIKKRSKKR
jgi:hypothetical protein